jgi:hypothetical protein
MIPSIFPVFVFFFSVTFARDIVFAKVFACDMLQHATCCRDELRARFYLSMSYAIADKTHSRS